MSIALVDKHAVIKNDFCFPVTVTVNGLDISVPRKASHKLETATWGKYNWMPGNTSEAKDKKVMSPLKDKHKPDAGQTAGIHIEADEFGYDFNIPEGTEIFPLASGVVIRVIDKYEVAHQDPKKAEANMIEILHLDGTVARYFHLKKDSIKVKTCDVVDSSQVIGQSGNTGFSSGPHLHVDVFKPLTGVTYKTIPLDFARREIPVPSASL